MYYNKMSEKQAGEGVRPFVDGGADQSREDGDRPAVPPEIRIKAAVADGNLVLESSDVITEAVLYSVNGTLLSVKRPQSEAVDFYLGGYTGSLYVVRCVLDNGKVEILKIMRD